MDEFPSRKNPPYAHLRSPLGPAARRHRHHKQLAGGAGMQGRSWKPLLSGAETRWRKSLYYEYFLDTKFSKETPCQALRTPTAKLIIYPGHEEWTELFELKNDPHETRNLVNDPEFAALLAQMKTDFIKAQQAAKAKSP